MRSTIIILLAVCSNLIEAGPVRHHGRFAQRDLNPQFTNASAVITTSDALQTPTPISISSTSTKPAIDALASSSAPLSQAPTILAQSQLASTSPVGDGSIAVTPLSTNTAKAATSTAAMESLPQSTPSFVAPPVIGNDAVVSQMSGSQTSSGLLKTATNIASNVQASSSGTLSTQRTSASAAVSSASSQAAVVQIPAKNTFEFSPVTTTSSAPKPSSTIQYPNAQEGNTAMASGFNQIYKTLQMTSSCDASDNNQAFACISGEIAQCQSDGTYVLKSCPMGQSCYALPLTGKTGVSVECAVPSDAAAKLAAEPSSASPNTMAASQAPSTIQQPATSPNAKSVSHLAPTIESPSSGSQAVSGTPSPESQPTVSRQGVGLVAGGINTPPTDAPPSSTLQQLTMSMQGPGLVAGGINTPPMSAMQQQAQTAAPSPSAAAEKQSQLNSVASQTAATFSIASAAKQSQTQVVISQGGAPTPTASQSPDAHGVEQSSSQAASEASATRRTVAPTRTSQTPNLNPIAQPSSQSTSETSPTFQPVAATSQSVAPTTASQNDNNQPHNQSTSPKSASQISPAPQPSQNTNATPADQSPPKITTSAEASPTAGGVGGFIFTPMDQQPPASSTPEPHEQHQPKSADTSAPTSTPQAPAQAHELPAAAKDTQPSPAAQSNQDSPHAAQTPAPAPSAQGGQFSIIPMGPGNSNNNNDNKPPSSVNAATNEKLVVNPGGSAPIHITVTTTVTTTAYTAAPSA
ncbi:hypothetical protein N7G274_002244 [Stereocaulon virgatum]|uniref:Carbohydrate-binding module family 19 domain-containing protein n=1 Tax=Stereocaulon virgatum TaxID=373712 RepID=A0ABR4AHB1_9LECA